MSEPVSREEFRMLAARVDQIDTGGTRGVGVPRLRAQRVGRVEQRIVERDRRSDVGEMAAHGRGPPQASRAQRKPAKIWRRMGKSQLRNVVRTAAG